jgi:hypothetical protein
MEGKKIYWQPEVRLLQAVNDIIELQNGKLTFSDTPHGKIHFLVRMYGFKWELRFAVEDIGNIRSRVTIEIDGERRGREDLLRREFALLDSMLGGEVEISG